MHFIKTNSIFSFKHNYIATLILTFLLLYSSSIYSKDQKISRDCIIELTQKALINMNNEKYEQSLIQSRAILFQALELNDNVIIAQIYNIIGGNFDGLLEPDKAKFYYEKGLYYANKSKNNINKYLLHNNLGNIFFFDKKDVKKGMFHYNKAIEYSNILKDTSKTVFTKINLAWAYFDIQKYDEGNTYLQYVNKHFKQYGDPSLKSIANLLNGMYYSNKKNSKKAIFHFENAIKYANQEEEKSDLSYAYLEYSKFLNKTGSYKKAYSYLEYYNTLTEEINTEEKLLKAISAGINLEIDEYKREIKSISNTIKTKENFWIEQQYKNKKIVIIIVILSIVSILLFYALSRMEKLKQHNRLKEIQSKIQQKIINATIDGQESERKKIAAFLHDNISALLSSASMHLNVFSAMSNKQIDEIVKTKYILEEAHYKVRDLSHELMPALLVRFGLLYALDDLCEKNSNSKIKFEYSNLIESNNRFEETFEIRIYFIISELLNNIIKHSKANQAILETTLENNQLLIKINDNGKGFEDIEINNSNGYGINRIKARINSLRGEFLIQSQKNEGTNITLLIPVG